MGSCSDMSSSPYRCRYVSWCVDTEETTAPTTAAPTEAAGENGERDEKTTFKHPCPLASFSKRKFRKALRRSHHCLSNPKTSSAFHNAEKFTKSHSEAGEDDVIILKTHKENPKQPENNTPSGEEVSALHPEDGKYPLLRSSPIISRHHRPISWLRGGTDPPNPSSSDSPSLSSGSPPHDQHGCLTATSLSDQESKPTSCLTSFPVQVDEKQSCVSLSSSLNSLQSPHNLPNRCQQGQAKEYRGQSLNSSNTPPTPASWKERSCTSFPDFPADIFKTSCELEKENAHFVVVDMVLEVLEGVKWTLSFDQQTSTMERWKHTDCMMRTQRSTSSPQGSPPCKPHRPEQDSSTADPKAMNNKHRLSHEHTRMTHTDTNLSHGNQHTQGREDEESGTEEAEHQMKSLSFLSTDSGFEDCALDTTLTTTDSLKNAEWFAQQLVSEFKKSWLPPQELRRGRLSLRSSLQELPGTGGVVVSSSSLTEEIRLRTRMRGSLNWAPPRFQIIFTAHPTHRRSEVVALQHFLCAGCGTEVEPRYIKKLRYCEYLGRYFCDCCHSGSEAVIPGRVLTCWDFSRYSVSDFSKQLLDSVWHQPLFNLTSVGKKLRSRVKELDKFSEMQEHLMGIKKLLKACRLSDRVLAELEQLPVHLMEQPLVFSMDDLLRIKKGQLVVQFRTVLQSAIHHIEKCELCMARGFICEFCHERDIIFPFQKDICKRCVVCRACFHKNCFAEKKCPKCARIQSRKKAHLHP
ncbi:protein associated with UVRAG as autophagy enhancer isoform X2 [Melanotaenia boesemani]|uniref:protein associated with UVRAG as autophagy enhancer isoform X2 n=1 Tax=Melanotaenia boesemani TaxID=1250792 RepID=UPI001C049FF9|nr:protein associated with UVRAG as autophagy enhancer isoform X2 [Melanotaenia boesemani]